MSIFKILVVAVLCVTTTTVFNPINAQDKKTSPVYGWGLTNGVSVNNFTYEQPHTGINIGYTGGGFVDRSLGKHFKARLNIAYTGAGGQLTTFKDDTRYGFDPMFTFKNVKQSNYLLHSVGTSINVMYQHHTAAAWSYYVGVGGGMENKFSEHETYQKTGEFIEGIYGTVAGKQFTNRFKNNWVNTNLSAGVELPTKKASFLIEAKYILGTTSVRPNYSYIEFAGVTGEIRTNAFQLTVGVRNLFKQVKN